MILLGFTALAALVFVLDTRVPLGANIPLLYIVPVLITIWHTRRCSFGAPAICTVLMILRVLWFPAGDWSLGLFNRVLTILALWSTAVLVARFRRAEIRLRQQAESARFGEMAMLVAHELRNALGGIRAAVEVFGARSAEGERDAAIRQEMTARVRSLDYFVADLLMLSGHASQAPAPHPVMPLIRRAVESVTTDAQNGSISASITGTDAVASLDDRLIESALSHLLRNAAQAMRGTGTINIAVTNDARTVRIAVGDVGPGIPAEIKQKVLDPFFTTSSHGRGLGLAIAKRAADRHGGSLVIESDGGKGTIVSLVLPLATQVTADANASSGA